MAAYITKHLPLKVLMVMVGVVIVGLSIRTIVMVLF
jgi:hypothetical protein